MVIHATAYAWLMLAGIVVSVFWWTRLVKRDGRLIYLYLAALVGAFVGAKAAYLFAEGWLHWHDPQKWLVLATGKSITGALLGGYVAVEIAKRVMGYSAATGDLFALVVPLGLMVGRVGCILNGCCLGRVCASSWFTMADQSGIARWPAALVELLFNAFMLMVALWLKQRRNLPGQHFHIYLIAYGCFRFFHEFLRDTPRLLGPLTGYQFVALAVAGLGIAGFARRARLQQDEVLPPVPADISMR